jgi:branched-chain amino acid aminotransferase
LYTADEAFVCGTLDEVRIVASVDGIPVGSGSRRVARAVRDLYLAICAGTEEPIDPDMLTEVSRASSGAGR